MFVITTEKLTEIEAHVIFKIKIKINRQNPQAHQVISDKVQFSNDLIIKWP